MSKRPYLINRLVGVVGEPVLRAELTGFIAHRASRRTPGYLTAW